jgi:hypothetical protein
MLTNLKNDLEQLFDKNIQDISMADMYRLAPLSKRNYHPPCPLCLSAEDYHVMFNEADFQVGDVVMYANYRQRYMKQFKHELFFHANLNQIIKAVDHFNGLVPMNPNQKSSLDPNSTTSTTSSTPYSDINMLDIEKVVCVDAAERGSKGAPVPLSLSSLYTLAIDKICKFHVAEIESFIETGMLKDNGATWFNYLIPVGPVRDYLIAHVDRASDGCFEMVSLGEDKCRVSIKKVKGPMWPL